MMSSTLTLKDGNEVVVTGTGDFTISRSSLAAHDVPLGYPHGPKTSEFIPKGATREFIDAESKTAGVFTLHVSTSRDAFACEDSPNAILGSQIGTVMSSRYNAIYDRKGDRLISFTGAATIRPVPDGFEVTGQGPVTVHMKPRYVHNHLGYFLWDNRRPLFAKPIAGWCSWMAHLQDVTEGDMLGASHFFAKNLKEYGYNIVQMDDGFQRVSQSGEPPLRKTEPISEQWTVPNAKFPSGLKALADGIHKDGMTPGIWVGLYLPLGIQHSEGYVTKDGKPLKGPWVNYAVNGLEKSALDEAYVKTIRDLKGMGWDYFKIDTLRHVLYDNYRQSPDYWKTRKQSMEQAYRAIMDAIKKTAGGSYVLACWGSLPELAGLPDGCRIGEDVGPNFASMRRSAKYIAQFHHLNNVVWRNDPDYMCLRLPVEQAEAWVSMTALAGGHLMVSDPVGSYDEARLDLLRKVGPPMMLRPTVVAPIGPDPEFMALDAAKGGERWTVLSRFAWKPETALDIPVARFGLDKGKSYVAFDFWQSKFAGVVKGAIPFKELSEGTCQVLSLRPLLDHPQVLGTDRHIGQGVVELDDVTWSNSTLSGTFQRVAGKAWRVFVYVPSGWKLGKGMTGTVEDRVATINIPEGPSGPVRWNLSFEKDSQ